MKHTPVNMGRIKHLSHMLWQYTEAPILCTLKDGFVVCCGFQIVKNYCVFGITLCEK
jgi:hypothetical protein